MLGDDGEMGQAAIAQWGPQMAIPGGYIVQPGQDEYDHWFGGDRWRVIDPDSFCGGPTLLLTLDLSDPRLAALHAPGLPELPFGSYIDSSVWDKRQVYRVEPQTRVLHLVHREVASPEAVPEDLRFPNPLPETPCRLRPMSRSDWPTDEDTYWQVRGGFAGGQAFIRVLGPPVWMHIPITETCSCGMPMRYICSIGYEIERPDGIPLSGFVPGREFYYGAGVLYFFFCERCREMVVQSQST